MADIQKVRTLKASLGTMMRARAFIGEQDEPIWVSDVLISLSAIGKEEEAQTLEQLIVEGHVRPGTRFDELAIVIRKLLRS